MFCFFFKLFTHCFVFIYFVARGGFGIPESIKHFLDNPVPAPAQPRQLAQPSQRRRHTNPSRAYCKISEFIWLYKDDIENLRGWIGHTHDPWGNDWRDLCISSTCIDKARAILQPGDTNPELVLELQLPTEKRLEIVNKHFKPAGFNFNDPSFLQESSERKRSAFKFTADKLDGFIHTVYGESLSPGNTTLLYNHEYDPTCTQLADSDSVYQVELLYTSPIAEVGYIGGKSMLK